MNNLPWKANWFQYFIVSFRWKWRKALILWITRKFYEIRTGGCYSNSVAHTWHIGVLPYLTIGRVSQNLWKQLNSGKWYHSLKQTEKIPCRWPVLVGLVVQPKMSNSAVVLCSLRCIWSTVPLIIDFHI